MADKKEAPVLREEEARQGRRVGVVWVLVASLLLAAIAGAVFVLYY